MKNIGRCQLLLAEKAFHAYGIALFTRTGKMTAAEATALADGCVKEVFNKTIHSYINVYVAFPVDELLLIKMKQVVCCWTEARNRMTRKKTVA